MLAAISSLNFALSFITGYIIVNSFCFLEFDVDGDAEARKYWLSATTMEMS